MDSGHSIQQLKQVLADLHEARHRCLTVISGDDDYHLEQLTVFTELMTGKQALCVSDRPEKQLQFETVIPSSHCKHQLGREFDYVVFDATENFQPNPFAAIAGTVKAGGMLLLLIPDLKQWVTSEGGASRFKQRFIRTVQQDARTLLFTQSNAVLDPEHFHTESPSQDQFADQQKAIDAIKHVVSGHSNRPLVISADRGRGKSSALGMASAELLLSTAEQIIITAPKLESVEPALRWADKALNGAHVSKDSVVADSGRLDFYAPDELIRKKPAADLVLVDEAAAIPVPMLEQLLAEYNRIVFSTTTQGYEGTGRGFELRFKDVLNRQTPQWQDLQLAQPIRWNSHDPLEDFLYKALLLNAGNAVQESIVLNKVQPAIVELDRDSLIDDEPLLSACFGLLINAHYQTSPSDLLYLLDHPDVSIIAALTEYGLVGAAIVIDEGGLDEELAEGIYQGQRRLKGHLIAQSLSSYTGVKAFSGLRGKRVMRIAVDAQHRCVGIGKQLINYLVQRCRETQFDWLGSSFGATDDLIKFWSACGFACARLGISRDAATGLHSAIVLAALSPSANVIEQDIQDYFSRQFIFQLRSEFKLLDPALVKELVSKLPIKAAQPMSEHDWQQVRAYANGHKQFESCDVSLHLFVLGFLQKNDHFEHDNLSLVIRKVLQSQIWPEIVATQKLTGKKQAQHLLQECINSMLVLHEQFRQ